MGQKIKEILLSAAFILVFGLYVIYERSNSTDSSLSGIMPNIPDNLAPLNQNKSTVKNTPKNRYKNGQYTGSPADAYYGLVQVKVIISGGLITDIQFLDYPQDRQYSRQVSSYALPQLKSEAIQSQSSNVDIVSGATDTSRAFIQSLASALAKAS